MRPYEHGSNDISLERLAWAFLRELDIGQRCTEELSDAVAARDHLQITAILMSLHAAWDRARYSTETMESIQGVAQPAMRDALDRSRLSARQAMAQAAEVFAQLALNGHGYTAVCARSAYVSLAKATTIRERQ